MSEANAVSRSQFLDFKLMREGKFSCVEQALLARIADFSQGIYSTVQREHTLAWLAKVLNKSTSTVRRAINSLVSKGILTKRYGVFKTLILKIIPLAQQEQLRGAGMIKKAVSLIHKRLKLKRKSPERSSMNDLDKLSVNEPIKNERSKEININIEKNFSFNSDKRPIWDIVEEQKARFRAAFPQYSV